MKYKGPRHVGYCPLLTHTGAASICRKMWQVKESWPESRTRPSQKRSPKGTGEIEKQQREHRPCGSSFCSAHERWCSLRGRRKLTALRASVRQAGLLPTPLYLAPCPDNLTGSSRPRSSPCSHITSQGSFLQPYLCGWHASCTLPPSLHFPSTGRHLIARSVTYDWLLVMVPASLSLSRRPTPQEPLL